MMETKEMEISPELAEKYLGTMGRNRQVNNSRVLEYCKDITDGNWHTNNDPISFDCDGHLINGQHRLLAIIKSKKPVRMLVSFNVPKDAVFDTGFGRSTSASLYMRGVLSKELSGPTIVAISKRFLAITASTLNTHSSDDVIADFILKHQDALLEELDLSRRRSSSGYGYSNRVPIRTALFVALSVGVPYQTLKTFVDILDNGYPDPNGADSSPAFTLRNMLSRNKFSTGNTDANALESVSELAISDYVSQKSRKKPYQPGPHPYIDKMKKDEERSVEK